ncbi:multimeric flavodoxin WrbA [Oceanotoga teriensis]|uniref:Multimeric flavodoxin WrbA n=1 Tax=Oceanotoga teriensis TaxID=515440 RepID=A0AA45HHL3_9BACT|nr:flavodoxin family protein [Oceanotoga teriensis]PWJ86057.1 multimeric flavodoxin WrbA [Oceanotoga teriensis]
MKVIGFNGSPNLKGNTYQVLNIFFDELNKHGIETEIVNIGTKVIRGCISCGTCFKTKDEKCVFDDEVNTYIQKIKESDGIILASPVHFSGITGTMKSFLDRVFYVSTANKNIFRHKVGSALVVTRRTGGMTALNQLYNYINYSEMIVPSSNYWNVIYGTNSGDINKDLEGLQIIKVLAKNMIWTLKNFELSSVKEPEAEKKIITNFIK